MCLKFDQFQAWNVELAALDQLKKIFYFETIQNILMTCWLSGERSLPFGLLVYWIIFILAGIEDNYNISDEFEIRQDSITDCLVSCP